jgi:hypothetical protein
MEEMATRLIDGVRQRAHPLTGAAADYDLLLERIGEADWPDAYRVTRYVRGIGDGHDAAEALAGFTRFPT